MTYLKALLGLALTAGLTYLLSRPLGPAPALGPLLSPFEGFWATAATDDPEELTLDGLKGTVTVRYDNDRVPHVFAENDEDLYFAQGYVTARDRLWQMEFQTHAAAGRLCEIVGERALPLDLHKRRTGTVKAAEAALKLMQADPRSRLMVEGYAAGVNTYIRSLKPAGYPVEYKLLGYAPEAWTPLKSALLLKEMTHTLANPNDGATRLTNVLRKYGPALTQDLFPDYPVRESPIIPAGTKWDFTPVKVPAAPKDYLQVAGGTGLAPVPETPPGVGSNNWAIAGSKSATGYPILAGDPHLTLNLPSIWYQIQLVSPTVNVCGVALPGSPGVIIGFNHDVAWSVTNVGSDVADSYEIRFRDATRRAYWHDGRWKPTTTRLETIKVKGQPAVVDTVVYTHHGPVAIPRTAGGKPELALCWIAHEPSNESLTYYLLNRARGYDDYVKALSHFAAPAQNFCFASNGNDIAIWVNGKFPLKWKEQGKYLLDGTNPAHDWAGWIPHAQNPHVKNPPRGFVSSANQFSTDPSYPYYLNWRFAPADRALRINERLAAMQRATPDSLRMLQNDNFNVLARDVLPLLLREVRVKDLSEAQTAALKMLADWNYQNAPESVGATIFEQWTDALDYAIWEDDLPSTDAVPLRRPTEDRTYQLVLNEPTSRWFDNRRTPEVEVRADIVTRSFKAAVDTIRKAHGPMDPKTWAWTKVKSTDILHLLPPMKAFGRYDIPNGGGAGIVNATTARTGPSWRMVVALGPNGPKAYGLYPGGQSGNPGSRHYADLLDKWTRGELNELVYLKTKDEMNPRLTQSMTLRGK
jgi:penicillin amidase